MLDFFQLIYSGIPIGHNFAIWQKGQYTRWFRDHKKAKAYIESLSNKENVYASVGLTDKQVTKNSYATYKIRECSGIVCFGADLDVKVKDNPKAHKKDRLPDSPDLVWDLLHSFVFPATAVLWSGNRIQAFWAFKEPWIFQDEEEREYARRVSKRFHNTLCDLAHGLGFEMDVVYDPTRILRIPGTLNVKNSIVKNVMLLEDECHPDALYDPKEMEQFLIKGEPRPIGPSRFIKNTQASEATHLARYKHTLSAAQNLRDTQIAEVPFDSTKRPILNEPLEQDTLNNVINKLEFNPDLTMDPKDFGIMSMAFEKKFMLTWMEERSEGSLAINDTSPSGYDYELAKMAAELNWSDQKILDMLIAHRKQMGHELHLKNQQKYARTIINARSSIDRAQAQEQLECAAVLSGMQYADKDEAREALKKILGVRIIKIIQQVFITEDPSYVMIIENNDGKPIAHPLCGGAGDFSTRARLRNKIIDAVAIRPHIPNTSKKGCEQWEQVQNILVTELMETAEADEDFTKLSRITDWLNEYLLCQRTADLETSAATHEPFFKKGHYYIHAETFENWTHDIKNNSMSSREFYGFIKLLKLKPKKFNVYIDNKRTSYRAWQVPNRILGFIACANDEATAERDKAGGMELKMSGPSDEREDEAGGMSKRETLNAERAEGEALSAERPQAEFDREELLNLQQKLHESKKR